MARFRRFGLGKSKPSETYEGDRVELEKGYVKIIKCEPGLMDLQTGQLVAGIHLDKGQSVRKIGTSQCRHSLVRQPYRAVADTPRLSSTESLGEQARMKSRNPVSVWVAVDANRLNS